MATRRNRELAHYFEYSDSGIEVLEDGLSEVHFGEYLIERHALSRQQLFEALTEQDKHPGVRLGEVIAALGYLPYPDVDRHLTEFHDLHVVEVGA